jgi:wyosine [tRNA(Phe)-imidazoG37] synthetase (radical SAM superfamily)
MAEAFGPVPSRRLGRSLGINNIPPKACTYACVYCQVGRTTDMRIERRSFYEPEDVFEAAAHKAEQAKAADEPIDYLTFVPDGEPTLDENLGREIALLRPLGIKIAVISNASLIWREDVRQDLSGADWVSLKCDAVEDKPWRRINRAHGRLSLARILEGALAFSQAFGGELVTETMLVQGVNDTGEALEATAAFLGRLRPAASYISVPIRPPAESWVRPPDEARLHRAYQLFSERVPRVEYLIGYEGNAFAFTGDAAADLLSITAVHPMRKDAVQALLEQAGADWGVVDRLLARLLLVEVPYEGERFFQRRLDSVGSRSADGEG